MDKNFDNKENLLSNTLDEFNDANLFEKQDKISSSEFNKIYKIRSKQTQEIYVAKKYLPKLENSLYAISRYRQEVLTLKRINHPSIVKYLGISANSFNKRSYKPIIFTEFLPNGTLNQSISNNSLDDTHKLIIIYGIANAMSFLHSINIIHRNLEPSHVLFDSLFYPKICGFGSSKTISPISYCKLVGKPGYIAPEVYSDLDYSKASDVYSFAFVVYAIMTGKANFYENSDDSEILKEVIEKAERPKFTENVPKVYQDLIVQCWSQDPKKRPSFGDILNKLKNDDEFITEKVDKKEYRTYIKILDMSPSSFDSNKTISFIDEYYEDIVSRPLKRLKNGTNSFGYEKVDWEQFEGKEIRDAITSEMESNADEESQYGVFNEYQYQNYGFLLKRSFSGLNKMTRDEIIFACNEANIPLQFNHPCITTNHKVSLKDLEDKPHLCIVEEFFSDIFENNSNLSETDKLIIMYGVAAGMAYLHKHNIIHRDLKAENIHLDEYLCPKISGFGLSREIEPGMNSIKEELKGTARYISPETYLNNEYSYKSDVYSYSLFIYELLYNKCAYESLSSADEINEELTTKQGRPTLYKNKTIHEAYRELIEECWSNDPSKRPTFEEILSRLKNDPRFITEMINKEQFLYYINKIDEFPVSYDRSKKNKELDDIVTNKLSEFPKIDINFNMGGIDDTEIVRIVLNRDFIQLSDFELDNEISTGSLYVVSKCNDVDSDDPFIAKTMKEPYNELNKHQFINFYNELNVVLQLNHPSILNVIGFNPFDFEDEMKPTFITEFASNGSLDQYNYNKKDDILDATTKLIIMYGVAAGMAYLHKHNIIHRDLKAENIHLDEYLCPKISGFGLSREIEPGMNSIKEELKGTARYISPETYLNNEYSYKSDVYSYSLFIYELLYNKCAYESLSSADEINEELTTKQGRPTLYKNKTIHEAYRELIEECWSNDPSKRPTFEEILSRLKNDPRFITQGIDKDKFIEYVNKIDEFPASFDSSKHLQQLDEFIALKSSSLKEVNKVINTKTVDQTETNKIVLDSNQINLNIFDGQKLSLIIHYDIEEPFPDVLVYECTNKFTGSDSAAFIAHQAHYNPRKLEGKFYKSCRLHSKLSHPAILKYVGYSPVNFKNILKPTILTEFPTNGNLTKLLEIMRTKKNNKDQEQEDTRNDDDDENTRNNNNDENTRNNNNDENTRNNNNDENTRNDDDDENNKKLNKTIVSVPGWDDTKKLIVLYGIASAMSYLNSQGIMYRHLRPDTIFLDQYLFPKIGDFTWAIDKDGEETGKPPQDRLYCDEDTFRDGKYTYKSDVFSFATIAFKILSNQEPYEQRLSMDTSFICFGYRPKLDDTFPRCYQDLLKRCWEKDINKRMSFDDILHELKTNPDFITEKVNKEEFFNYVKYVDSNSNDYDLSVFEHEIVDLKPYAKSFSVDMKTINLSRYEKEKKIGKGSFGTVYTVREKDTGKIYAAKVAIFDMDGCSSDTITNLEREIEIISKIDYPSVMKYIGYSSHDFKGRFKPTIITEFAANGSLDRAIELEATNNALPNWNDTKKLIILKGIAAGMDHLQEKGIVHRDMKPANIFLDENLYPKIGDFGLSKENSQADENLVRPSGFKGTYAYCAPESLLKSEYTEKSDVYSFGMIMYELMTNRSPFKGCNIYQVYQAAIKGFVPEYPFPIPECYKKLIEECLSKDPNKRPSFYELSSRFHQKEFINEFINEEEFNEYKSLLENFDLNHFIRTHHQIPIRKAFQQYECRTLYEEPKQLPKEINASNMFQGTFIDLNNFKKLSVLTKRDVYKIYKVLEKSTGKIYSAKVSMLKIEECSHDNAIKLSREINFLSMLDHPSFVKFIGYSPVDFKGRSYPVVITELASEISLENTLLNDTIKLICIYGIAAGMSFLHNNGIVFRNLMPSNIHMNSKFQPKIGDLGLSTMLNSKDSMTFQSMSGLKGLPIYSAPEVLQYGDYSFMSDVYSFAMVAYEIVTGNMPFKTMSGNKVLEEIVMNRNRPEFEANVPEAYRELIERCWLHNSNNRPTFDQIVNELKNNHDFITENVNQVDYLRYIDYIDQYVASFEESKKAVQLDELIKLKRKIVEDKA